MLLVFDLGGSAVKFGLWDGEKLSQQSEFKTPTTYDGLKKEMLKVKEQFKDYGLQGISLAAPGVVDVEKQMIRGISAIPYIHFFNIFEDLTQTFGLPVKIENDANCAGLAEVYQGVAKGKKDVLFVVVGTGVGGAVFNQGQLLKGAHLYGGEFGLMILDQGFTFSELGTAVRMGWRYCDAKNVSHDRFTGKQVFDLAEAGDKLAQVEVEKFYNYLAQGLFSLQFTLDPEVLVLGGGISAKPGLIAELNKRVKALCIEKELTDITPEIVACQYRNDANLIGAAMNFSIANNFEWEMPHE
ncbi:ROK family protein [Enterococcus timonensis]|uniref:ROK family protein n=1 Tax=Enterococcus timonensis TaxID=1852364 RepID=UPI0008D8E7DB|nr:ROK family protein [Enterococcus timonensis]